METNTEKELSTFGEHMGTTIYVSIASRNQDTDLTAAEASELTTRNCTSISYELDKVCGWSFICYWDSDVREAAVVNKKFEEGEKTAAGFDELQNIGIALNKFHVPTVMKSTPTEDGFGMQLQIATEIDTTVRECEDADEMNPLPLVAVTRTRRSRLGKKRKTLKERKPHQELLKERLQLHQARLYDLCDRIDGAMYIQHWYQSGRTLAFASTFTETGLGRSRKAIVALFWHTTTRPHRAVCVSFSLLNTSAGGRNEAEQVNHSQLVANCSCSPMLSQTFGSESGCYHAQVCFEDESFRVSVKNEIRRREDIQDLHDRGDKIFGQCIPVDTSIRSPSNPKVILDRTTSKGRTIACPWVLFMIFDRDKLIFVPVCKVKGKCLRCFLCRIPLSRRGICGHEESAKIAAKASLTGAGSGSGLLLDVAVLDDDSSTETEKSSQERDETEGNNVFYDATPVQRSVYVRQVFTPIDVRRSILPCQGEWTDMITISKVLRIERDSDVLVLDERTESKCHECGQPHSGQHHEGCARHLYLFSLNQGTHRIRFMTGGAMSAKKPGVFRESELEYS